MPTPDNAHVPTPRPRFDVIVLGLGGMGSAAAADLAGRGQRVLGLERFTPAHDMGSSHGDSRLIRQSYFEDPAYVPLLLRSYELWKILESATKADLLTLTGGLFFGAPSSRVVAGSLRSARQWDLPHDELDAADIRRRFPTTSPGPDDAGLFEQRGGFVRPEAAVRAHLELAARRGADLRFGERVLGWAAGPGGAGCEVRTTKGTFSAERLVIAPGAWASEVLGSLGLPLTVTRQVLFWFQPRHDAERFDVGRHPVYVHEDATGTQVYGFPGIDGPAGPVKVAFFRLGEVSTPGGLRREVLGEEVDAMRSAADRVLPDLAGDLVRSATCMYTNTPDEHFVVAVHPDHSQVVVGCGFSGHGFKFVPVIGEILGDLSTTGSTRHPIALFDPARATLAPLRKVETPWPAP